MLEFYSISITLVTSYHLGSYQSFRPIDLHTSFLQVGLQLAMSVRRSNVSAVHVALMLWCCSVGVRSSSTSLIHVNAGLPLGLSAGLRVSCRAFCAGVSGCSLSVCPKNCILRCLIFSLHFFCFVIVYSFSFEIILGYLIFMAIRSRRLWKLSFFFTMVSVGVHSSAL